MSLPYPRPDDGGRTLPSAKKVSVRLMQEVYTLAPVSCRGRFLGKMRGLDPALGSFVEAAHQADDPNPAVSAYDIRHDPQTLYATPEASIRHPTRSRSTADYGPNHRAANV